MKKRNVIFKKILSLALAFLIVFPSASTVFAASSSRAAKVTDFLGTVNVLKSGGEKKFKAFKGMSLSEGDSISTAKDSWVELEIDDDKLVKITENTQLGISELTGSVASGNDQTGLKLWFGKVWTNIKKKLNVRAKYEIRTPKTVMGVRGTQFFVGTEAQNTVVAVLEGKVLAVTYSTTQRPDGSVLEQAVQAYIESNQQSTINESFAAQSDINVVPVSLNSIDATVLVEIMKAPQGISLDILNETINVIQQRVNELPPSSVVDLLRNAPNLPADVQHNANQNLQQRINEIDSNTLRDILNNPQGIDQSTIQQVQVEAEKRPPVENNTTQENINNSIISDPGVSNPVVSSPQGPGGNNSNQTPPLAVSNVEAANGLITLTFNQAPPDLPLVNDFVVRRVINSETQTRTIRSVEQVDSTTFKLLDYPLQPGSSLTTYHYSISYKNSSFVGSNNVSVQPFKSADVVINGSSTITSGSTVNIGISNIKDQNDTLVNSNEIYDNSVFNVRISSDRESSAAAVFSNVSINHSGMVTTPSLGIILSDVGTHTLTVEMNGKVLANNLVVTVNPAPTTTIRVSSVSRVSLSTSGGNPNNYSDSAVISRDGRYVNYSSFASNIVTGDTNSVRDIFVYDRTTQTTNRINLNTTGNQVSNGGGSPFISSNGRFAAFVSRGSDLVSGDTNAADDVFIRDLTTSTNNRVSLSDQNSQVNPGYGFYANPQVSNDGRYAAFTYTEDNLVQGDTNGQWDVFVRDLHNNSTRLVSISDTGDTSNTSSHFSSISGDGRYIAYTSGAVLAPGASGFGIYIKDLTNNTTKWMTKGSDPFLSTNGRFIAFTSTESDIVAGDTNGYSDIFVMDRDIDNNGVFDEAGKTEIKRVNVTSTGIQADYNCYGARISDDGRYVSFYSSASNLVNGDTNGKLDVFVRDCVTGIIKIVSVSGTGTQGNDDSFEHSMSGDGKYIVFRSNATNLVANDTNNQGDIFLAELHLDAPLDTTPPTPPSNINIDNVGPSWSKITWGASSDNLNIASYNIYRSSSSSGPFNKIASVSGSTLSYWDKTLSEGSQYYYYVTAVNEDGLNSPIPAHISVSTPYLAAGTPQIIQLAAGQYHSVYRKDDGTVWAWGYNNKGQLGIGGYGSIDQVSVTTQVYGPGGTGYLSGIAAVEAGQYFTAALKDDGTVYTWGDNYYYQLGSGTSLSRRDTPGQVPGLTKVKAISAGAYHVAALRSDGTVWTWGYNSYGQLGDGTTANRSTPVPVLSPDGSGYLTDIIAISAGDHHTAALREDGTIWVFGSNSYGQFGIGSSDNSSHTLPVQVGTSTGLPDNIASIASGANYIMALTNTGNVWAWGENYVGQLGDATTISRTLPVQVKSTDGVTPLGNISKINPGSYHCIAVSTTGDVFAWGNNNRGKLGNNDTSETERLYPVPVIGPDGVYYLSGIVFVAAGKDHSLALKSDGTVLAWGDGYYGQLGNNSTSTRYYPVQTN